MRSRLSLIALAVAAAGCSSAECFALPCPFPFMARVSVSSSTTHSPVTTARVVVNGDTANATPCNGTCYVPGIAGKYHLDIIAPGYQSAVREITVTGVSPQKCGCETVNQQTVDVALAPASLSS